MTPAELACHPGWTPDPVRNVLFAELAAQHGLTTARRLWTAAADWHRNELAAELAARSLRGAA